MNNYSPQTIEKTDSKRLSLATASILGQPLLESAVKAAGQGGISDGLVVRLTKAWARPDVLSCPDVDQDYAADPADISRPLPQ